MIGPADLSSMEASDFVIYVETLTHGMKVFSWIAIFNLNPTVLHNVVFVCKMRVQNVCIVFFSVKKYKMTLK